MTSTSGETLANTAEDASVMLDIGDSNKRQQTAGGVGGNGKQQKRDKSRLTFATAKGIPSK